MALPLYWIDEALTSRQAESDLREAGLSARAIKQVVDQQAAVRILETFLAQPENRRTPA